jgi:hypothetical protein
MMNCPNCEAVYEYLRELLFGFPEFSLWFHSRSYVQKTMGLTPHSKNIYHCNNCGCSYTKLTKNRLSPLPLSKPAFTLSDVHNYIVGGRLNS